MTLDEMISNYLKLRDRRDELKKAHADVIGQYDKAMELIKGELKKHLKSNNIQRTANDAGTAFIKTVSSATVADKTAFRNHVILKQEYDLIDFRANKTGVEDYLRVHNQLPPGVNYSTYEDVGVQKN